MKLFIDMDGVLSDHEAMLTQVFGQNHPHFQPESKEWQRFINDGYFGKLPLFPGALDLVTFIEQNSTNFDSIEILSSTGSGMNEDLHKVASYHKAMWLQSKGILYHPNFVMRKSLKKDYAVPRAILIDDSRTNCREFVEAGGDAIIHHNAEDTIETLKLIIGNRCVRYNEDCEFLNV